MEQLLKFPDYSPETGILLEWEDNFELKVTIENGCVLFVGNKAGLITFAKHIVSLAQDPVPDGTHIHYDEHNSLEEGSIELILQRG